MEREELLGEQRLSLQLGQALSDLRAQKDMNIEQKQYLLQADDNCVQREGEYDISYKYKRNKKSKDQTDVLFHANNQTQSKHSSVVHLDTYEQMEKKIAAEQDHIRSMEERKKILMHDDLGNDESAEAQENGVTQDNKNNNVSMKGISPAFQASEISVPPQSQVTFNPANLESRKSRPSDMVNFDEKSEANDLGDHSNPLTDRSLAKEDRRSSNTAEEIHFYQNDCSSNEKLDDDIKDLEEKLKFTKSKILKIEQQNAIYAEKQKKDESSHGLDESQGNCSKSTPNEAEEKKEVVDKKKRKERKDRNKGRKDKRGKRVENDEKRQELKKLMKMYEQKQRTKGTKTNAAIIIQKWIRGYLQRKEYRFIKFNVRKIRKLRRILSVGYKKIKTKFIKSVVSAMKISYEVIKKDRNNMLTGFLNACAIIIQKHFRGYLVRKYIVAEMMEELKAQNRALDMLKKWQMGNNLMYCNCNDCKNSKNVSDYNSWCIDQQQKYNLASAYYQNFLMQPNQLSSLMPNMNPNMFTGQSYQFGNQPLQFSMEGSGLLSNRMSIQPNELLSSQLITQQEDQYGNPIGMASPLRSDGLQMTQNIDNTIQLQNASPQHPYDTANEQIPLKRPNELKDKSNAKIEFDNDQFNMNSTSKFVKTKQKVKVENFDDMPVGSGATGGGGGGDGGAPPSYEPADNVLDIEVIRKKPKKNKKKDLEKKKEFLKRRKGYDPRKAIENAKENDTKKQIKRKHKSAFPKGFFKHKEGEGEGEQEDIESSKSEILKDAESKQESHQEPIKYEPNKQVKEKEKEVKVKQESRSEKRKSRARKTRDQRQQDDTDEGSPECRLDSTPKRKEIKPKSNKQQSGKFKQSESNKEVEKINSAVRKSKNVQFHKLNWENVPRKIDCWQNIPVPNRQENCDDSNEPSINRSPIPERMSVHKPQEEIKISKVKQPGSFPEETRLIESLNK